MREKGTRDVMDPTVTWAYVAPTRYDACRSASQCWLIYTCAGGPYPPHSLGASRPTSSETNPGKLEAEWEL